MLIQPYSIDDLKFAYSNCIYFRFRTHRRKTSQLLTTLDLLELTNILEAYQIRPLEWATEPTGVRLLASLLLGESAATAMGKVKGRISKWINERTGEGVTKHLARGYFAVTTGKATKDEVLRYLDTQGEQHGYADRVLPPVYVEAFPRTPMGEAILRTDHAVTELRYHLVLTTERRHGVFLRESAIEVTKQWQTLEAEHQFHIDKVSFVPDHVHVALVLHPAVAPAKLCLMMLNISQELMWKEFAPSVIQAKVNRLWNPGAYLGSFGDLRSAAMSAYIKRWESL
jgi:REP element-mobilizing transposase RayT